MLEGLAGMREGVWGRKDNAIEIFKCFNSNMENGFHFCVQRFLEDTQLERERESERKGL